MEGLRRLRRSAKGLRRLWRLVKDLRSSNQFLIRVESVYRACFSYSWTTDWVSPLPHLRLLHQVAAPLLASIHPVRCWSGLLSIVVFVIVIITIIVTIYRFHHHCCRHFPSLPYFWVVPLHNRRTRNQPCSLVWFSSEPASQQPVNGMGILLLSKSITVNINTIKEKGLKKPYMAWIGMIQPKSIFKMTKEGMSATAEGTPTHIDITHFHYVIPSLRSFSLFSTLCFHLE